MKRIIIVAAMVVVALGGCAVVPDKFITGVDHTSHLLQHFEHESDYGMVGCTGPMAGFRWEGAGWFAQATEKYCAQGLTDNQHEVANLQAGIEVNLK